MREECTCIPHAFEVLIGGDLRARADNDVVANHGVATGDDVRRADETRCVTEVENAEHRATHHPVGVHKACVERVRIFLHKVRIANTQLHRIRVVDNVLQLRDRWCICAGAIEHPNVALLRELVLDHQRRQHVLEGPRNVVGAREELIAREKSVLVVTTHGDDGVLHAPTVERSCTMRLVGVLEGVAQQGIEHRVLR